MGKCGVRSCWVAFVRGARPHTPMRQLSTYAPRFSVARLAYRFGLAYELLCEVCTIAHRISEMHRISADEQGWGMKWLRDVPTDLRDAVSQVHNVGIQNLQNRRPWVTAFDVALYHEGLQEGVLSQLHSGHTEGLRISSPSSPPVRAEA
jgi:hypothetical protein